MPPQPRFLTITETARAAARLTGRPCTARRVRYLLVDGRLGTDIQARPQGQTRLFGTLDIALVRLALRLQHEGVSAAVTRVVLTYLRNDIVRALKAGAAVALKVDGLRGALEPAAKGRPADATAWVPLREVWHGVEAEIERIRAGHHQVWMWRRVPVHSVPRASAT